MQPPKYLPKRYIACSPRIDRDRGGRMYFKRIGRCTPKKCGQACCRIFHGCSDGRYGTYLNGFVQGKILRMTEKDGVLIKKDCAHLKPNGKCDLWPNVPGCCYQFPTWNDKTFRAVKKVCGFKFVRITKKEFERIRKARARAAKKPKRQRTLEA